MRQLTVTVSSYSDAEALLVGLNDLLIRKDIEIIRSHANCIELQLINKLNNNKENSRLSEIAHLISKFIVEYKEAIIIRTILQKQFKYEDHELFEIIKYCKQLLLDTDTGPDSAYLNRQLMISKLLAQYLQTNSHVDIDGFIHFRLKTYMMDLHDAVEDGLNEFMLNEQYQEFITLLKYFVYFQDAKIEVVHLIHQGNNKYQLLDSDLQQLEINDSSDVIVETVDRELNYEDMVVSTLISASPRHIHIHTREPETQSIKTIEQIFEGRTLICTCCKLCELRLGERKAEQLT